MIDTVWLWVVEQLTTNDVFSGLVGLSLMGSVLFTARALPGKLLPILERQFTVELTIHNTDEQYHWISMWLAKHEYSKKARRMQLTKDPVGENQAENGDVVYNLVPGAGRHFIYHKGRFIVLQSIVDNESSMSAFLKQSYRIHMLGRSQSLLREIVDEAASFVGDGGMLPIYSWCNHYWAEAAKRRPRSLDSVILVSGQKENLVADASKFFESYQWYYERGIPWRRGYLFHGSPGTGKTSLVTALAGHFKRPIYVLSLSGKISDESVMDAFRTVAKNGIILVEDIDAVKSSHSRSEENSDDDKKEDKNLTLSGLLNAIDGVSSAEGRLLIMTTNHPDKLDPALVRSGRVDRWENIGLSGRDEAVSMFRRFYPDRTDESTFVDGLALPMPAADIQMRLLELESQQSS